MIDLIGYPWDAKRVDLPARWLIESTGAERPRFDGIQEREMTQSAHAIPRSDAKSAQPCPVFSRLCTAGARRAPSLFAAQLPEETRTRTRRRHRCIQLARGKRARLRRSWRGQRTLRCATRDKFHRVATPVPKQPAAKPPR